VVADDEEFRASCPLSWHYTRFMLFSGSYIIFRNNRASALWMLTGNTHCSLEPNVVRYWLQVYQKSTRHK